MNPIPQFNAKIMPRKGIESNINALAIVMLYAVFNAYAYKKIIHKYNRNSAFEPIMCPMLFASFTSSIKCSS